MRAVQNAAPLPAPVDAPPLVIGEVIAGRYLVEAPLGVGGMASVYRATHLALDQPVAIKVASESLLSMPGIAERFLREARAATRLKTPHVARVHDVGKLTSGAPYMVMELLEGRDLDRVVQEDWPLEIADAVDYVLQACEALAEVHGRGMVHRDVKPGNLFVVRGEDGRPFVKLIDFGIARAMTPVMGDEKLTQTEVVMGSPRYMAPEQIRASHTVDERADIYSLGVVLYELVAGTPPFEGSTFLDFLYAATEAERVPPSKFRCNVPHGLDAVVLSCLEPDPLDRPANVAELARALAAFGGRRARDRAENVHLVLTTTHHDTGRSRPYSDERREERVRSRIARRPRLLDDLESPSERSGGGGAMIAVFAIALLAAAFIFVRARPSPATAAAPTSAAAATPAEEPVAAATLNAAETPAPDPSPPTTTTTTTTATGASASASTSASTSARPVARPLPTAPAPSAPPQEVAQPHQPAPELAPNPFDTRQ